MLTRIVEGTMLLKNTREKQRNEQARQSYAESFTTDANTRNSFKESSN